jgi:hypothetical protein
MSLQRNIFSACGGLQRDAQVTLSKVSIAILVATILNVLKCGVHAICIVRSNTIIIKFMYFYLIKY